MLTHIQATEHDESIKINLKRVKQKISWERKRSWLCLEKRSVYVHAHDKHNESAEKNNCDCIWSSTTTTYGEIKKEHFESCINVFHFTDISFLHDVGDILEWFVKLC
jgi:hypothetical protein